jgi:prophage DNA circulation protein
MATAPLDLLKPFSFDDIPFPYKSYRVTGGIRKHEHQYPHNPGAAVEKLGRELYKIDVSVNFTGNLLNPDYADLLTRLGQLREEFENQTTAALNIPHIGTIQACAEHWIEGATNLNRSTITADLTFYEDLNSALAFQDTVILSAGAIGTLADAFKIAHADITPQTTTPDFSIPQQGPNTLNLFEAIDALAVSISGIKDQQELFGALVSSKIDGLLALFKRADTQEQSLNDPQNHLVLDAMHALWKATLDLKADLQDTGFRAQIYVTPVAMNISQVSYAIYNNTLAAAQLMQLNDLDDPLRIPPQTQIIYYPALERLAA